MTYRFLMCLDCLLKCFMVELFLSCFKSQCLLKVAGSRLLDYLLSNRLGVLVGRGRERGRECGGHGSTTGAWKGRKEGAGLGWLAGLAADARGAKKRRVRFGALVVWWWFGDLAVTGSMNDEMIGEY